jgi:hypothetical protein
MWTRTHSRCAGRPFQALASDGRPSGSRQSTQISGGATIQEVRGPLAGIDAGMSARRGM